MRIYRLVVPAIIGAMIFMAGCRKNAVDKSAFKAAINDYYAGRQECLWAAPKKLPVQADASDDEQTKGYDALTDAGMLSRKAEEKKRFLIGSKQVTDYDLSDKGRGVWNADQTQPGYGNFCFGHREVTTIDNFTPSDEATQYSVNYHYDVSHVPDWAGSTEMKTAFPTLAADTSGQQAAIATLSKSSNGWMVVNATATGTGQ